MQVDWFTVGAQIVNFLVLVYLLKRFLYGPIVRAMDRREQRVTDRLQEAQEREASARQRETEFHRKTEEFEERRKSLFEEARREVEEHRKDLVASMREEVEDLRRRWREEVNHERESFLRDLRGQAASSIARATRQVLREFASTDLEERIVAVFQERIQKLDAEERDRLIAMVRDAEEPLSVVTTFELPESQRDALRDTLEEVTGERTELRFAESADLVCGVELRAPGAALAWSIDGFVSDLADDVDEGLRQAARDPTPDREPTEPEAESENEAAEPPLAEEHVS